MAFLSLSLPINYRVQPILILIPLMSDPLPPFALLPSYLTPSALSLLTWTTAQTSHCSPFHLLKPILLTTSRENFLMYTSNCIAILLMISSGQVTILFIIYLIKAQLFSITFLSDPASPQSHISQRCMPLTAVPNYILFSEQDNLVPASVPFCACEIPSFWNVCSTFSV